MQFRIFVHTVQPESQDGREREQWDSGLLVDVSARSAWAERPEVQITYIRYGTVQYIRYVPKIRAGNWTAISPSLGDHQQLPITLLWAYFRLEKTI
jgi:hypothetical protein